MSRTSKPKSNPHVGSTDKILAAAGRVFAKRGFAGATVQEVADEAGMTKPTVYNHFGGKAELYVAVMDRAHGDILARMHKAAQQPGTAYERVAAVLDSQVTVVAEYADLVRVAHSVMFLPERKRPMVDGQRYWEERFEILRQVMAEGVEEGELQGDPKTLALAVSGVVGSIALARAMVPDAPLLTDDVEQRLWDVIYQGAKK